MSEIGPPRERSLATRLFEPPAIGRMAPATKFIVYLLLAVWTLFVLFPIYWVLITSFKTATDVNAGPFFLPFIDFQPSLHAWKELFVFDWEDTLKAYGNSIIISLAATALSVLIGSMAAYALARIEYRPKFGTIMLFVLLMAASFVTVGMFGVDWRLAVASALAAFFFLARALSGYFKLRIGNGDILFWMISQRILAPIVVVVPIYGSVHDADAVTAIGALFPGRHAVGLRADAVLTGGGSFHCASQHVPSVKS